jgi:hypothetical protein
MAPSIGRSESRMLSNVDAERYPSTGFTLPNTRLFVMRHEDEDVFAGGFDRGGCQCLTFAGYQLVKNGLNKPT